MAGFSDGIRTLFGYCIPSLRPRARDGSPKARTPADAQAASDAFRQGEQHLFRLLGTGGADQGAAALQCFETARAHGHGLGAAVAGLLHEAAPAPGAPPAWGAAFRCYEDAAARGDPLGACLLGGMAARAPAGLVPVGHRARKQLLRAAQQQARQPEALAWLHGAADGHGLGAALYMLGACTAQGIGTGARSDAECQRAALALYEDAARRGVNAACRALGRCLLDGTGAPASPADARYWLCRAATEGRDPEAMALLAEAYECGRFQDLDDEEACLSEPPVSVSKAEIETVPGVLVPVSGPVSGPVPVPNDPVTIGPAPLATPTPEPAQEVAEWLSAGPEEEVVRRQRLVRRNHERDSRRCFAYASEAAQRGSAAGRTQLARCHELGVGIGTDQERARALYAAAADAGHAPAQFALACLCAAQDAPRSTALARASAEAGYVPAMLSLALLHTGRSPAVAGAASRDPAARARVLFDGTAVLRTRDPARVRRTQGDAELAAALVWWRRAAKRASRQAQFELARAYRDGLGCPVDLGRALCWMRRAAQLGLPEAQLELGILLVQVLPASQSAPQSASSPAPAPEAEAFYWILRAAKNGLPDAQVELAQLFLDGRHVHRNASSAFYWFRRAAQAGHPLGQLRLGAMLVDGAVTGAGAGCVGPAHAALPEAVRWLRLASEQGCADADRLLPVAVGMASEESCRQHQPYIY